MLSSYQHLPENIDSIAFSIGNFDVRWYSLMYLVGFTIVYILLACRARKDKEDHLLIGGNVREGIIIDFLIYAFVGLMIGARIGYVLCYDLSYFLQNPLAIVSPLGADGSFVGIFGMSYFGGLFGIILASILFCRRNKIDFWQWADFVIPAIPAGYFFGRIGNFLNGELYGKATDNAWGMYFSGILRWPTQLIEASLEGIALFIALWFLQNRPKFSGYLLAIYLFGYGTIRFFVEFLREPEGAPCFGITTGQILSLMTIAISAVIFLHKIKKL